LLKASRDGRIACAMKHKRNCPSHRYGFAPVENAVLATLASFNHAVRRPRRIYTLNACNATVQPLTMAIDIIHR
jgi:hypothetical protein